MLPTVRTAALLLALLALGACQHEPPRTDAAGSVAIVRPPAGAAAAHPIAVEAGLEILRAGGSAVDAAVAVQMALTLVEPQSSGIGGGTFMVLYRAADRSTTTIRLASAAPLRALR